MPGRNPNAAYEAFIEPLERSLSCLASAKLTFMSGARSPGAVKPWTINRGQGVALRDGWHFAAEMHYEIIRADAQADSGAWRVTTRAYRYRIGHMGKSVVLMHWHPVGRSTYTLPHLHMPAMPGGGEGEKGHLPLGRITFEDAVEWAIVMSGQCARSDWSSVLAESRDLHIKHRSWSDRPPGG